MLFDPVIRESFTEFEAHTYEQKLYIALLSAILIPFGEKNSKKEQMEAFTL